MITPCPDAKRLEGLLQNRLPPPEQSALTEHVGDCAACQQVLDNLAGGPSLTVLAEAERDRPASDSAYWSVMEKLDQEITHVRPGRLLRPAEVPLDFLSPPDEPGHLGRLDHFAVLGVVGKGGMGIVLRGF